MSVFGSIFLLFLFVQEVGLNDNPCVAITAQIAVSNIHEEQIELVQALVEEIVSRQATGSSFTLSVVGKKYSEIGKLTADNIKKLIKNIVNHTEETFVSTSALISAAWAVFTWDPNNAEIFILIAGNTTRLQEKPIILTKKKVFVVVIGEHVPETFLNMPTTKNHLFGLSTNNNLSEVSRISAQICTDSHYPCDVDKFKSGTRCKNCTEACEAAELVAGACEKCPYFPKNQTMGVTTTVTPDSDPHTRTIMIAVSVAIVVIILIIITGTLFYCRRHRQYCFYQPVQTT